MLKGVFSKIKKDKPMSSKDKRINHMKIIMSIADSGQLLNLKETALKKKKKLNFKKVFCKG